jgi:hypothetical protein
MMAMYHKRTLKNWKGRDVGAHNGPSTSRRIIWSYKEVFRIKQQAKNGR